jgi:hypothetical protein
LDVFFTHTVVDEDSRPYHDHDEEVVSIEIFGDEEGVSIEIFGGFKDSNYLEVKVSNL